jgi:pantothenate kinase
MESTINGLAKELLERLKMFVKNYVYIITYTFHSTGHDQRILVGICGIPASGKSSLAHAIVQRVNDLNQSPVAIACGLDGWHLSRSTLASMPNPQEAFTRRGAHWTFDGNGYVDFVQKLKSTPTNSVNGSTTALTAPTFSHSIKDPVADGLTIEPHHRIVVLEGLYVFLSIPPWGTASELLDERWFVDVDIPEARKRIVERHVRTGVTTSEERALERAEMNDFPSA